MSCGQTIKQSGNSWEVIEPDGTQYYFGLNQLPGYAASDQATNSLWTVPVWEGCGQAAHCNLPWRYNLDYVVDPHGNAIAYYYSTQANSYAEQNGTAANATYTPNVVTSYSYAGPAWHYDTGTVSHSAPATYDQWRGFGQVTTETGTAPDPVTQSTITYLQGMSQNGPPSSTGPVITLTTSRGQQVTDLSQFAGTTLEQIVYNGAGSAQQVSDAIDLPWTSTAVVVNTSLNQAAYLTGTSSVLTFTPMAGVGTRESVVNYAYNSTGAGHLSVQHPRHWQYRRVHLHRHHLRRQHQHGPGEPGRHRQL